MADKQYDISPAQKRLLEEKAKYRAVLRERYIKEITNPHKHATGEGGTVFDSGVQRFMSMKTTSYDHFKPTPKTTAWGLGLIILPVTIFTWLLKANRDAQEKRYRTGQVAYKDRRFKFI